MKKILLSVILALAIAVSFLPVTASAETVWTEVSDDEAFIDALKNGGHIKLKDYVDTNNYTSVCSGDLVIDLNGNECGEGGKLLDVEGNLTILDSSSDQSGCVRFVTTVKKGGTLTLNSGTMKKHLYTDYGGTFTMNGGVVNAQILNDGVFIMNGGTVEVERSAIYVYFNGVMHANGGTVKSLYDSQGGFSTALTNVLKIVQDDGTSGTVFDCQAKFGEDASFSGASYMKETENRGTITDGIFYGNVLNASSYLDGYGNPVECQSVITGGTFKGAVTNNSTITGGTFYGGITGTGKIDGLIVTYKNGSEDYAVQVVQNGDNAVNPIAPTKTGYLFDGWYEDEECTKAFDFENTRITENRTIYSKWKVCDHTGNTNDLSCTEDTICSACGATLKAAHLLYWKADATHYWQECYRSGCDYTTVNNKKEIPTIEIKGKDKVHTDQDYSFSFELPEDSTVVRVEYAIPLMGSSDLKVNMTDGIYTGVVSKDNYAGAESFKIIVTVEINDGYTVEVTKNVMLTDEHEGGTATCKEQAICQICLQPYGSTNPKNHTGSLGEWQTNETLHWKIYSCCNAQSEIGRHTDSDNNHICDICGYDKLGVHADADKDHKCDYGCTTLIGECVDKNLDHHCDYGCDKYFGKHADNDDNHNCDYCGQEISKHSGGTATCNEKAICKVCLEPYGEKNPNNHTNLKQFPENAATAAEEGNKEYWYCDGCQKYFSDENAENEIKLKDTVIAKLAPTIIKGDGQTVTVGEKKALEFTSDAAFEDFISIEIDGKTIDESNYTVKSGSTVVTLNADYVATLSAGEHTLGIVSQSGTATAKFTVNKKVEETTTTTDKLTTNDETKSPQTGDNSNLILWLALLFVSGGAVTVTTRASKKKRHAK